MQKNLTITIHLPPPGLHDALKRAANKAGMSIGRYVARVLIKELKDKK